MAFKIIYYQYNQLDDNLKIILHIDIQSLMGIQLLDYFLTI